MTRLRYQWLKLCVRAALLFGRNQQATALFDELLLLAPGDAYTLASRGHLKAHLGDRPGAIADFRAVTTASPDRAEAWFNLGFLLEQEGAIDEAEAVFRRAIALDERLDKAWYGLGLCLIRQHRFDDAVAALKRNTELQPMSPFGWYQLARVHVDRQQPEEAKKIIDHLKGFEPKVAAQLERETGLVSGSAQA
jgi:Flp pilus assembly protein TadD